MLSLLLSLLLAVGPSFHTRRVGSFSERYALGYAQFDCTADSRLSDEDVELQISSYYAYFQGESDESGRLWWVEDTRRPSSLFVRRKGKARMPRLSYIRVSVVNHSRRPVYIDLHRCLYSSVDSMRPLCDHDSLVVVAPWGRLELSERLFTQWYIDSRFHSEWPIRDSRHRFHLALPDWAATADSPDLPFMTFLKYSEEQTPAPAMLQIPFAYDPDSLAVPVNALSARFYLSKLFLLGTKYCDDYPLETLSQPTGTTSIVLPEMYMAF